MPGKIKNKRVILRAPNIDFQRIHPLVLVMGKGKATRGKVSLYFHDAISWLKSAQLSLKSYRTSADKLKDKNFVKELNETPYKRFEYLEELTFFLENAVIRLTAIRDKLALVALVYYLHPSHLGSKPFLIKGCPRCKNKSFSEPLTEKNCNFGGLMNFLRQENVDDVLYKKLREIEKDEDIRRIVSKRNLILHRISEYRWIGLGIHPNRLNIEYKDGKEIAKWNLGSPEGSLLEEVTRLEKSYNNFVGYIEELAPILFSES